MLSPTKYARGYLVARLKINGADEKYSAETLVAGLQFVQESIMETEPKNGSLLTGER